MKIITVSDCPALCTGLAKVHRNVIDGLADEGHEVLPCVWFGFDTNTLTRMKLGDPAPELWHETPSGKRIQMAPVPKRKNFDEVRQMFDILEMSKPDIVLTIGDYIDFYYMQALKVKREFSFKWFAYLTIEMEEIDERIAPVLKYADILAAPTKFGTKVLEKHADCPVHYIPYGVDPCFRRLGEGERKRLREERGIKEGEFRFITVAQNTMRKNLPCLMQAVACLGKEADNMRFYLHTNVEGFDPQEASIYLLRKIASKLGVSDKFEFPKEPPSMFSGVAEEKLVEEYNASDAFVTPTLAEGFGLPLCEAMACGLPVIAADVSCLPEHLGARINRLLPGDPCERGWLAETREQVYAPDAIVQVPRSVCLAARLLDCSRADPTLVAEMGRNCQEYAKGLRWEATKRGLCEAVEKATGPSRIPVETV